MRAKLGLESQALFAEAELHAERTVALLRIVVAAVLASVFLLAVVPDAPTGEPQLARQWAFAIATMSGYLLLGVVSYVINIRGLYRPWMAWLAVSADVLFMLANVWLGLINTGLPANYIVGLPAIWLVPVVLAFGALRYNPALQVYVVLALLGGLVGIAFLHGEWTGGHGEAPPAILAFLFSAPPDIMRLSMLALAGLVLAIAGFRARALLTRAVAEARRRMNLTRYLPHEIAHRLAEDSVDALRRGRRQPVAVLFVDIRGFTGQAEAMQPEALSQYVTEFRRRVARAAATHGGVIDKFVGDAAMVVFGLVRPGQGDAAAALACARAILAEIRDWSRAREQAGQPAVAVGIGIHYGDVFCGAVGDESRLEYTVLGDVVNVAARLEERAKQLELPIIASAAVLQAAAEPAPSVAWQAIEGAPLRGRAAAIRLFGSDGATTSAEPG